MSVICHSQPITALLHNVAKKVPTEYWMTTSLNPKTLVFPSDFIPFLPSDILSILSHVPLWNFAFSTSTLSSIISFIAEFSGWKYKREETTLQLCNYILTRKNISRIICGPQIGAWALNVHKEINCSLRGKFKGDFMVWKIKIPWREKKNKKNKNKNTLHGKLTQQLFKVG